METEQATPNANQQQQQADANANRTAGEQMDAGVSMTQAQIDAIVQSRLAEERRRLQTKYGDLDELAEAKRQLDEKRQAEMSETEKLQRQIRDMEARQQQLQAEAEAERLNALRLRVGQEIGLPPMLASRLSGTDEESIKADAQAMLSALPTQLARIPNNDATAGGAQGGGRRPPILTPAQRAIADMRGMSYESYAALLQQFEE